MEALGSPVVIDGSHGEGGATLVRTALVMAAITQQPVRVEFVRGATPNPGLKPEDLAILRILALSTSAEVVGAEVGSSSFSFLPTRSPRGLTTQIAIPEDLDGPGSANALVMLNAVMPVMAQTGVYTSLTALGETFGAQVLSYDYFANVTLAANRRAGLYAYPELSSAGFGRKSRGEVSLEIEPSALSPIEWGRRGKMRNCRAIVSFGEVTDNIGERGVSHLARLGFNAKLKFDVEAVRVKSAGPGAFVTVWAEFEKGCGGATAMGSRGVRIESVVQSAFEGFMQWHDSEATVDPYLADQLLVTASLANGQSSFSTSSVTERLLTTVWVVKQFIPIHITVRGQVGSPGTVTVSR
jgi:RNA 3'-terminal phosphate cyclase (ATP)